MLNVLLFHLPLHRLFNLPNSHSVNPRNRNRSSSNFPANFSMESDSKTARAITPVKEKTNRSKSSESLRHSENVNPNESSPGLKLSNSPSIAKSAKKSAAKNLNLNRLASPSPKKKLRERKFVIAKKKSRNEVPEASVACVKCKKATGKSKCLCLAYESLRASQDEFFKSRGQVVEDEVFDRVTEFNVVAAENGASEGNGFLCEINRENKDDVDEAVVSGDMGVKRSRDKVLVEAREAFEITRSGKVRNLVKAFENLTIPKPGDDDEKEVEEVKEDKSGSKWELCEMQQTTNASETRVSCTSFSPSDFQLTSESLGLDPNRSYSLDSARGSISTITSAGSRKIRRSSTESSGIRTRRHWKRKQPKATCQKPFMLRTEERGRWKEEELMKKLRQKMEEEEKMRIPVAQGLPWTTDEPECLVKPPVKEITRPVDLVLHSDVRAVERSEFDFQVAVKMNIIEQYRMERERQQKLEEEEEIKRLRKELVPKAQPLPYFDRPFIPKRSVKNPTIPKEPKFHIPEHKKIKCYLSLEDLYAHQQ